MFDFFRMPHDWPGRQEATSRPCNERGAFVESALHEDIAAHVGADFNPNLFIPYVQMHEFETLLFADVSALISAICETDQPAVTAALRMILTAAGSPEAINDGDLTAPSKRITQLLPNYKKTLHGPTIAGRIGLTQLRESCPHFGDWLTKLESLSMHGA